MDRFLECVEREISTASDFLSNRCIKTIYFGGGTPSIFSPLSLQRLIDFASQVFDCSLVEETTIEVNPDDVNEEFVSKLSDTSFNRVSIGIQSMNDELLRFMNRRHDAKQAKRAVDILSKGGFSNISTDVIFGISGFEDTILETLRLLGQMGVQHISAYHLSVEPGTRFALLKKKGALSEISEEESEREFSLVHNTLVDMGFDHYEISNFALGETFRSRHNMAYWTSQPYLGFGPGAHSYDGSRIRRWSFQSVYSYVEGVRYQSEELSSKDLVNELLMTRLRTSRGLAASEIPEEFRSTILKSMQQFLLSGKLLQRGDYFYVPSKYYVVLDHILSSIFIV